MPHTSLKHAMRLGAIALAVAVAMPMMDAKSESFTLRIGAGQPMKPLEPIFMAHNYLVPKIKERVAKETSHKIRFIEAYGGTVAGPFDVLESVEKGLFDIGLWCACFEPTKAVQMAFHYFVPFVTDDPMTQHKITRKVYREFPQWTKALEKYNQKWLGAGTFSSYGLGTKFKWKKMSDLKGHKIAGAGPNLPWLKLSGATAVQTSLNEAYNSLQSGVYEGLVIFPTAWLGFKLNEPAPVFTVVGWGATSLYQMTMNLKSYGKLPAPVRKIIDEESENWMVKTAEESTRRFDASLKKLKATGSTVQYLPFSERAKMAAALGSWPSDMAKKFDSQGLPGSALFKRYLEIAEEMGVKLPHKFKIM